MSKPIVLVLLSYYLPGFKGGGPLRTVSGTVHFLGSSFVFYILTKDRDLGDKEPYPGIKTEVWKQVENAYVCYLPPEKWTLRNIRDVVNHTDHDFVYLNGIFETECIFYCLLRWLNLVSTVPVILAPRGEMDNGALAQKPLKKSVYLYITKLVGLYNNILWQAASEYEQSAILEIFPQAHVIIAPDLAIPQIATELRQQEKQVGSLRLLYLSRITPKKNLTYAIECLADIQEEVVFDIYGPVADDSYWQKCQSLIERLPDNISVTFYGPVTNESVMEVLRQYHALFLPTYGENYGHVLVESLAAGCLLLISNQTPWRNLEAEKIGWDLPLENTDAFRHALKELIQMNNSDFELRSQFAQTYVQNYLGNEGIVEANRHIFQEATKKGEDQIARHGVD